ncbi:MAG: porin [Hyphomicrobium sp.]|jgi:hypothetical protein
MYGGVRGGTSLALVLAMGLLAGARPADAADLGGDCCADLEERVAELEATTARKGNRKVSLEVSGHVNQGVLYWDDGWEENAYVVTNDNSRTRFRFRGKAKIDKDWEAGYRLEIGVRSSNSKRFNQSDLATSAPFDLRDSYWYLKSKTYGTVAVGLQSSATDGVTEINLSQTKDFAKYSDIEDTGLGLYLRRMNGALASGGGAGNAYSYYNLIGVHGDQPGEGEKRFNGVKYTTPELAGFTASAFWGQDDYWDASLNYSGEHAGFAIEAGIGYGENTDGGQTQTACAAVGGAPGQNDTKCSQFGGSISVLHKETGLFANFGAGIKKDDIIESTTLFSARGVDDEQTFWSAQGGIEKKWNSLGKTTVYGEYYHYEGGANTRTLSSTFAGTGTAAAVVATGVESYGFGVAQGIDAAALTLYLSYRHVEGDISAVATTNGVADNVAATAIPLEDLNLVFGGGIIKF